MTLDELKREEYKLFDVWSYIAVRHEQGLETKAAVKRCRNKLDAFRAIQWEKVKE